MDRARFPRDKVCAGWVTPQVWQQLALDPAEYRAAGLTCQDISGFRTGVLGGRQIETRYPEPVSYAIRRCEFDDFLLRRAGAPTLQGTPLERLERRDETWIINDAITTPLVIGAGGHFCPVARHTRQGEEPKPVVAQEIEFLATDDQTGSATGVPELFFCDDLGGYGWCVPKGAYLNVGLGHRDPAQMRVYLAELIQLLERRGALHTEPAPRWHGHAYLAAGAGVRPLVGDGLMLVGDSAGLAYPKSGEGIGPAVESGRLAAETLIEARGRVDRDALAPYARRMLRLYPPSPARSELAHRARAIVGRALLKSAVFARHVLLDRWFLRRVHDAA
jgi:flavin-dependent dehydrogenase